MARLMVMPAPQANLLGGVNLLFHNGKAKAKDKGKGKAKGKDDTDDTEASVGCVRKPGTVKKNESGSRWHGYIR